MSKVVDTDAPRLTLLGDVMVKVLQAEHYEDAGATVGDNIDGNTVVVRRTIQLCTWQAWMQAATPETNTNLVCSNTVLAAVQTSLPLATAAGAEQVYVLTYTARDSAENQAAPVRRYVGITPRCGCLSAFYAHGSAVHLSECRHHEPGAAIVPTVAALAV
jgi:hypothetical protein